MPYSLARTESSLATGESVTRSEVLVSRPFSAGTIRCVLSSLADGPWLLAGLQVQIASDFLPAGPLATWHDAEPFQDTPDEEPAEGEAEGEA